MDVPGAPMSSTVARHVLTDAAPIALERAELAEAFEWLPDGLLVCDGAGGVLWANTAARELLGVDGGHLLGVNVIRLLDADVDLRVLEHHDGVGPVARSEVEVFPRGGGSITAEVSVRSYRDAEGTARMVVALRDVTAQLAERRRLRAEAEESLRDPLTGLHNRRGFAVVGSALLRLADRQGRPALAVFVDLDGLKVTNDVHGHRAGDERLVAMASALAAACRSSDVAVRMGGDEFVLLAYGAGAGDIGVVLEHLVRAGERTRGAGPISLGWALYRAGSGESLEDLVHRADLDMYDRRTRRGGEHRPSPRP
ncbi:MAG: GGDEF domain-containing protein [Microthrixaceae bacterium]